MIKDQQKIRHCWCGQELQGDQDPYYCRKTYNHHGNCPSCFGKYYHEKGCPYYQPQPPKESKEWTEEHAWIMGKMICTKCGKGAYVCYALGCKPQLPKDSKECDHDDDTTSLMCGKCGCYKIGSQLDPQPHKDSEECERCGHNEFVVGDGLRYCSKCKYGRGSKPQPTPPVSEECDHREQVWRFECEKCGKNMIHHPISMLDCEKVVASEKAKWLDKIEAMRKDTSKATTMIGLGEAAAYNVVVNEVILSLLD